MSVEGELLVEDHYQLAGWTVIDNSTISLYENGTVPKDCCSVGWQVTEKTWWWFGCVMFIALPLLFATIKHCSRLAEDPKAVSKNKRAIFKLIHAEEDKAIRAIPKKPVEKANFIKYCEQHRKYPILFKVEFQHAGRIEAHPCRHGTKPCNEPKNQNHKIVPYDYNRVVLDMLPADPDPVDEAESDYINASYVDSLLKPNAYIVTQGPNERTLNDFWRMMWKERSPCIVMLTKTFDFIKVMCVQYWPVLVDREEEFGDISVTLLKEEQLANFVIRTIKLKKDGEERTVLQFHYTEWPCHSCPFSNAILEFRRRIRICLRHRSPDLDGPIVVHCSDGAGRSGVFLAIDANIELAEEDGVFDVYGYLKKMRQSRRGLIETIDQYKFVYDTLEEFVTCGYSSFPVSELSQRLKEKAVKGPDKLNDYQREFNQICRQVPKFTIGDCAGGHRADNRHKNRDVMIVPPDNFRPYLTSFQGTSATDYINAVFVDEYNRAREYIVTEWPLRSTQSDFWSLVYDHDCNSIVVLTSPGDSSSFPHFWPESTRSKKYGAVFTVEHISHQHYQNIKSWIFKINKKEIAPYRKTISTNVDPQQGSQIVSLTELMAGVKAEVKTCQLFQLTCWPAGYKVPTSTNALVELMNMVERWRQRSGYGPVVVVSPDGQCRAGVYCAANACIEQVIQHGEVDVFQAVKTVRRHRPQLISNMTEYKYCYDLVLHYVLHYLNQEASGH
ncbi:receptor-type tyrosine-protein phosphatase kappa-like isoform X2 [Amphibalanus amphitrite]|nr:receptor-type tyrosine-protein phosphatase kappa-like isoform X2 [Amphibalanus amphitrite]XP_043192597.1 receptor-type tyrosine-protein phosphatase kappa-like isoform X2 [Amphibalanus amphitrite]XP_043215901.1 receptor-type tyrosine-protein phosphatase kappa-like isoform X2 [Amphibalanus amphitrite]XP_043215902.1 receptor-type tyrosine-protein phosphatase kappa-like isoform X2 [Amphibalanus amphitrite]XP_043215904.1 receptor-type tyrosine-protein phosphatase kappa-like isoform X2 [Amphibalan